MRIKIELTEDECKSIIYRFLEENVSGLQREKVKFHTKSKQNYKSEWEVADFKVVYEH